LDGPKTDPALPGIVNIFTEIFKLETKSISSAVKTLKSKLLISIEEKNKIKGIKIHISFQVEIKKYLERIPDYQYIIKLKDTTLDFMKDKGSRENLNENNLGTKNHYYNFKAIKENIMSSLNSLVKYFIIDDESYFTLLHTTQTTFRRRLKV
jgi:hypothetical protein